MILAENSLQNSVNDQTTDEEIVALTLKNQDFFIFLIKRYQEKLLRYITRISNSSTQDAEDILQNVFIKAYKNLNDFDQKLKFSSWIYRITHNEVINNFRKNKNYLNAINWEEDDTIQNIASEFNLEQEINDVLVREKVLKVLKGLKRDYQEILQLRFFEQLEYGEISQVLKKPMGTIATLINRAKKQFKKDWQKHYQIK